MPDGDHLLIGLHHPRGAAMTRFKREANLQGWDGCSTRHDGLLAAVMSDSQEAAPSGVGPPETRHHSQVEVVSVEYSSRTLPKSWQLCRKCSIVSHGLLHQEWIAVVEQVMSCRGHGPMVSQGQDEVRMCLAQHLGIVSEDGGITYCG